MHWCSGDAVLLGWCAGWTVRTVSNLFLLFHQLPARPGCRAILLLNSTCHGGPGRGPVSVYGLSANLTAYVTLSTTLHLILCANLVPHSLTLCYLLVFTLLRFRCTSNQQLNKHVVQWNSSMQHTAAAASVAPMHARYQQRQ